jgi:hypothetical protein
MEVNINILVKEAEDGRNLLFGNVGIYSPEYTVS